MEDIDALLAELQNSVPGHSSQNYGATPGYGSLRAPQSPTLQQQQQQRYMHEPRSTPSPSYSNSNYYNNQGSLPRSHNSLPRAQTSKQNASNITELDVLSEDLSKGRYNNTLDGKETMKTSTPYNGKSGLSEYNNISLNDSVARPSVDSLLDELSHANSTSPIYAGPNDTLPTGKSPGLGRPVTITLELILVERDMYSKIREIKSRSHSDADDGSESSDVDEVLDSNQSESETNSVTEYVSLSSHSSSQNKSSSKRSTASHSNKNQTISQYFKGQKLKSEQKSLPSQLKYKDTKRKRNALASNPTYTYDTIIGIHLHHTSALKFKKYIRAPRIKVSIYDVKNRCLAAKSDVNRNVVVNIEPDNVDFILPIMSKEGCLHEDKTFSFDFNETLIINEDIEYIKDENVVIFFEVLDTVVMGLKHRWTRKNTDGWHYICWAFVKPVSSNGLHINKRRIVQMYKYRRSNKNARIFEHWSDKRRKKYPGTLEVTIKKVKYQPEQVELNRPHTALQKDKHIGEVSYFEKPNSSLEQDEENVIITGTSGAGGADGSNKADLLGSRAEKLLPLIKLRNFFRWRSKFECPAQELIRKQLARKCLLCRFNSDGTLLAFTAEELADDNGTKTDIVIAQVPNLVQQYILKGHTSGVHCLRWMPATMSSVTTPIGKQAILSTSEDHTCILWFLAAEGNYSFEVLPHICPIYSAEFLYHSSTLGSNHETKSSNDIFTVASGGRNAVLYIWQIIDTITKMTTSKKSPASTKMRLKQFQYQIHLRQEISKHESKIVDVVYSGAYQRLYTGDVGGTVVEWISEKEGDELTNEGHVCNYSWKHARLFHVGNGLQRLQIIDKLYQYGSSALYALTVSLDTKRKENIIGALHKIDTKIGYHGELFRRNLSSELINSMTFDFVVVNSGSGDARYVLFTSDGNRITCQDLKTDSEVETITVNSRRAHMSASMKAKKIAVDCIKAIDITINSASSAGGNILAVVSFHKQLQENCIFLYGPRNRDGNNTMVESKNNRQDVGMASGHDDGILLFMRDNSNILPSSPECKKNSRLTSFLSEVLERCDRIIRYGSSNTSGYKLANRDDSPSAGVMDFRDQQEEASDDNSKRSNETFTIDNITEESYSHGERMGNTRTFSIDDDDKTGGKSDNTYTVKKHYSGKQVLGSRSSDTDVSCEIEFLN